jgi:multiple sugar transport system substrate-binding protein
MKAKGILFVVALVMVFSISMISAAQEATIEPLPCEEAGELTMWVWDDNWHEIIGSSIDVWVEEYCPGAEVELIHQSWGDYWDLIKINAAGGDLPDVFNMSQDRVGFYLDNDVLLNLQPYWDEFGVDTAVWGSGLVDPYRADGDLYAAPVEWTTITILYNKDMFDAADLEYPTAEWTWDDFAADAAALTNMDEGVFGAAVYMGYQTGYTNWIAATGESPAVSLDRSECTLTSEASLEALNYLKGLYDEGYMPSVSDMGGSGADDAFNLFASGQVAMISAGSWKMPDAVELLDFNWEIVQLPRHPETGRSRSNVHAVGYVASARSENADLAANLVLFLASDQGQMFFAEAGGVAPGNPNPELQSMWAEAFAEADVNIQAYIDATDDSHGVVVFGEIWGIVDTEIVVDIFDLDMDVAEAAELACEAIDEKIAEQSGD